MTAVRALVRALWALAGLVVAAGLWELYKLIGPARGWAIGDHWILPRAADRTMPHLGSVVSAFGKDEVGGAVISAGYTPTTVFRSVLSAAGHSLWWAGVGFLVGAVVGLLLAVLMDAVRLLERALLPYIVLSQTVPLIALAPLVSKWGRDFSIFGVQWQLWMSVSVIAGYLAFFPVTIGMARGLRAAGTVQTEYFRSVSAGYWRTLLRLKIPTSVPYLVPALRLAAAAAVVGTVIGEISVALEGGIGRLIISYAEGATGDPSRLYTAVIGAAALGLVAAGLISVLDVALRRFHRTGDAT